MFTLMPESPVWIGLESKRTCVRALLGKAGRQGLGGKGPRFWTVPDKKARWTECGPQAIVWRPLL